MVIRPSNKIKRNTTYPPFPYLKHKPVIYLYPKETMDISVNLNIKKANLQQFIQNLLKKIHGM